MNLKKVVTAIPQTVNGIRFDSKLEAEAYKLLITVFGKSRITCHESISYRAKSAFIPELNHKVDFVLRDEEGNPIRYIEVKGTISGQFHGKTDYIRTLILLETLRPNVWDKYVLWIGDGNGQFTKKSPPCDFASPFPSYPSDVKTALFL